MPKTKRKGKKMKKRAFLMPSISNSTLRIVVVLLVAIIGTYLLLSTYAQTTAFVRRSGTQLTVNGNNWRMTGYNAGLASRANYYCGYNYTDAEVGTTLDHIAQASKGNTVRVWYLQSLGGPQDWSRFDLIVNAAKARNMYLVVTLVNQWGDCEPQVNGAQNKKSLSWYQTGYKTNGDGYSLAYRDFVKQVAQRYANEPSIAMWQLVNEAEAPKADGTCDEVSAKNALRSFGDDMASVIHSVDANHLINLGTIGSGQCGTSGSADFQYVHAGLIDVCEIHNYGTKALSGDQWNGVQTRINDCHAVGKPVFNGEDGIAIPREAPDTASRASYFDTKFATGFNAGLVGDLVWSISSSDEYLVKSGDPVEAIMAKYADPSFISGSSGDATAPTAQITSPVSGSTVSGTINVTATASDNTGVTKVEFYVDGRNVSTNTSSPFSYQWNTTGLSAGSHSIQAKAYDAAGNVGASNIVSVSILSSSSADTTPPVVTINAPTNGSSVQSKVTINSTATDTSGITMMEIKIDGKTYASGTTDSLTVSWNTNPRSVAYGAHTITVTAKDSYGNSTAKSVTVYK